MAPRPGSEATRRPARFARAVGIGTFVVVFCGAVASAGDTQRFAIAAIAAGVGWAVLCAVGRWLGNVNVRDLRRAAGAVMIVSAVSDILRLPPGRRLPGIRRPCSAGTGTARHDLQSQRA